VDLKGCQQDTNMHNVHAENLYVVVVDVVVVVVVVVRIAHC